MVHTAIHWSPVSSEHTNYFTEISHHHLPENVLLSNKIENSNSSFCCCDKDTMAKVPYRMKSLFGFQKDESVMARKHGSSHAAET